MLALRHYPKVPTRSAARQEMPQEGSIRKSLLEFGLQDFSLTRHRRRPVEVVIDDQRVTRTPELRDLVPEDVFPALRRVSLDRCGLEPVVRI